VACRVSIVRKPTQVSEGESGHTRTNVEECAETVVFEGELTAKKVKQTLFKVPTCWPFVLR
jgi:hypothetical protein